VPTISSLRRTSRLRTQMIGKTRINIRQLKTSTKEPTSIKPHSTKVQTIITNFSRSNSSAKTSISSSLNSSGTTRPIISSSRTSTRSTMINISSSRTSAKATMINIFNSNSSGTTKSLNLRLWLQSSRFSKAMSPTMMTNSLPASKRAKMTVNSE
jgi:hypothetical protein